MNLCNAANGLSITCLLAVALEALKTHELGVKSSAFLGAGGGYGCCSHQGCFCIIKYRPSSLKRVARDCAAQHVILNTSTVAFMYSRIRPSTLVWTTPPVIQMGVPSFCSLLGVRTLRHTSCKPKWLLWCHISSWCGWILSWRPCPWTQPPTPWRCACGCAGRKQGPIRFTWQYVKGGAITILFSCILPFSTSTILALYLKLHVPLISLARSLPLMMKAVPRGQRHSCQ